ncbi:SCO2525 family SAM-dependent methyltransferase [Phytohabitans kaempferiae]|uniref:SCO2525 family SAM-dependent methyltransferase n=1 Tax=Phytohabitans kaempferiae TaxID=1620943 RepID=A0ABV6M7L6_9ACTN
MEAAAVRRAEDGALSGSVPPTDDQTHVSNSDAPWDEFDADAYWEKNYSTLRDDDEEILRRITAYFAANPPAGERPGLHTRLWRRLTRRAAPPTALGLDVGPGTNLYPALAMLPYCRRITLWEYSATNVRWLRNELRSFRSTWDVFWGQATGIRRSSGGDTRGLDPRPALARRVDVRQASIFDLPKSRFDVGTMFFVAESLTSDRSEFERATRAFVESLRPGAPFAAAFMEGSVGYQVGACHFPAVPVTIGQVKEFLTGLTPDLELHQVFSEKPLREGYHGTMILALGRASGKPLETPPGTVVATHEDAAAAAAT